MVEFIFNLAICDGLFLNYQMLEKLDLTPKLHWKSHHFVYTIKPKIFTF